MNRNKRSYQDLLDTSGHNEEVDDFLEHNDPSMDDSGHQSICFGNDEKAYCLTREFQKLPMESREKVGKDLYGVGNLISIDETCFEEFAVEIAKIKEKQAYELACSLSPEYVQNEAFSLMFLRATEGNAKKAAKRITRHFETKLSLFGESKLVKDIEISDLDEDDMESLKSGGFQVLPQRDHAGRSVLFGRYTSMRYKTINNMLRALWYIWTTIMDDETNQMKGIVSVGYEIGRVPLERFDGLEETQFELLSADGGFDRELAREIVKIPLSLPVRPASYHLCTDSDQWVGILNMVMVTLCKFIRLRMKIHHGSDQEIKYALMTHGFPVDKIPVNSLGDVDMTNHFQWIEERTMIEAYLKKNRL